MQICFTPFGLVSEALCVHSSLENHMKNIISIAQKKYPSLRELDQDRLRILVDDAYRSSKGQRFLAQLVSVPVVGAFSGVAAFILGLNFSSYVQLGLFGFILIVALSFVLNEINKLVLFKALERGIKNT